MPCWPAVISLCVEFAEEKRAVAREKKSMPDIERYLEIMVEHNASDLFFSVGAPVNIRIEGVASPLDEPVLTSDALGALVRSLLSVEQLAEYDSEMEMNLGLGVPRLGRFRINIYRQRGEPAMVIRYLKTHIPSIEELNLPPILKDLIMEPRGLILVVGATGSGKSTTLAAMINHRNERQTGHIITVEDPIEFTHEHKLSIVDQREVGIDTLSYGNALKNAMREAPDVIMIGEIRDLETMRHAITYAETGHLCLSTLHANNSNQTLDRIVNFFPDSAHKQLLTDLSGNLKAIISQRLVKGVDGKRLPVVEVLLNSLYVSDLIAKGEFEEVKDAMDRSEIIGMCTFDQALFRYYQQGRISEKEALRNADSRNNLQVKIHLTKGVVDASHLHLHDDDGDDEGNGNHYS